MKAPPVFPLLDRSQLPAALQATWDRSMERRGEARFIAGVGHAPPVLDWFMGSFYQDLFYGGEVPVRFKELGRLRLSTIHGCLSCNQGNRLDAQDHGVTDEQIKHIGDTSHHSFDAADRAVLALAQLMSMDSAGVQLDQQTYDDLSQHFSNAQIIELAMTLSLLSGVARFLFAFDLVEKEDYCTF